MYKYDTFVEFIPIKDYWLIPSEKPTQAQELAKIIADSISQLQKSPPDFLKGKNWHLVSHSLTPIESHLILSYILHEED